MAQRIQTLFIDDIDGGAGWRARSASSLDGADYEIDLSGEHSDELRAALGKYVGHGRKVGGSPSLCARPRRRPRHRHRQGPRMGQERATT